MAMSRPIWKLGGLPLGSSSEDGPQPAEESWRTVNLADEMAEDLGVNPRPE
jgi:hypothetical protein